VRRHSRDFERALSDRGERILQGLDGEGQRKQHRADDQAREGERQVRQARRQEPAAQPAIRPQ